MPLKNQLHVDKLLSNISVKYRNSDYIHDMVFPALPVQKDTDLYRIFSRNFRIPETARAAKAVAREHDFDVTTGSYKLQKHALKMPISDDEADNYDIGSLRADATEELTDKIMMREEKRCADLFTTTNWSLNVSLAAASAFTANTTTSNPIMVYDTAATEIINNSGFRPNFGILPRDGYIGCKNHTSVLDRVKYTSSEMTPKMLAALFDLPELLIPTAQYDTSAKGLTDVITNIWGDVSFVGYKAPRPSPLAPSCGYKFRKARNLVKRWRDEERESEMIEVNVQTDWKIVASLTGFLIKDIT